ncbi:MFS transporter [Thermosulfuriphilus sp.]
MGTYEAIFLGTFASLRHPYFRLFFLGQAACLIGIWMQTTAQRWLVLELTNSPAILGLLGAVGSLPVFFFSFLAGWLADRLPKRRLLLLAKGLGGLQALTLGFITQMGWVTAWHILSLAAFLGLVNALELPVRQAYLYELVEPEDITNAVALHSSAFNLARFLGPALAGLLMARWGAWPCFYLNALGFLAVVLALFFIPLEGKIRKDSRGLFGDLREALSFVVGHPLIRSVLLLVATFSICLLPYAVLLPVFGRDILGVGARGYGFLMAANGAGAFTGAIFLATVAALIDRRRWIIRSAFLLLISLLAFAWSRHFYLSVGLLYLSGINMVFTFNSAISLLQTSSPSELRGRVMGLFSMSFLGLFPLGSLFFGWLAERFDPQQALSLGVFLAAIAIAYPAQRLRMTL